MLKNQLHFKKIYLVTGRTDLRNGIQGLAALVRLKFGKNPLEEETLFLFCGNDRKTVCSDHEKTQLRTFPVAEEQF